MLTKAQRWSRTFSTLPRVAGSVTPQWLVRGRRARRLSVPYHGSLGLCYVSGPSVVYAGLDNFQYPTTGRRFCDFIFKQLLDAAKAVFQYPTTGRRFCDGWKVSLVCRDHGFQYPTTGRRFCVPVLWSSCSSLLFMDFQYPTTGRRFCDCPDGCRGGGRGLSQQLSVPYHGSKVLCLFLLGVSRRGVRLPFSTLPRVKGL